MIRKPGQEWRLATDADYRASIPRDPEAQPLPKPIEWPKRATEPPAPPKAKAKVKAKGSPRPRSVAGAKAAQRPRKQKPASVKSE